MGNIQTLDRFQQGVHQKIPADTSPPSATEIVDESKRIALEYYTHHNPTSIHKCLQCARVGNAPNTSEKVENVRRYISSYELTDSPYSEKNFVLISPAKDSQVLISSTKNSDHTVSYWVQYPVMDFHIRLAFLKLMNISVTPQNISDVSNRYNAVFNQCKNYLQGETVKCEQVDPLYMDNIIKNFLRNNYQVARLKK